MKAEEGLETMTTNDKKHITVKPFCAPVADLLQKPYLNEREVAELTDIAVQTLRNNRCNHTGIPYLKLKNRRKIMYRLSDVITYMESCLITFKEVHE